MVTPSVTLVLVQDNHRGSLAYVQSETLSQKVRSKEQKTRVMPTCGLHIYSYEKV